MFLAPDDLTAFADIDPAKAALMIEDAEAMAALAAPCLSSSEFQLDEARVAAVRAILRGALIRWHDAGSGAVTQQSAGPFSQSLDTRQQRRGMFWPSEIAQLRDICAGFSGEDSGKAFEIDTTPPTVGAPRVEQFGLPYGPSPVSGRIYYSSDLGIVDTLP